jgi:mannose-6-phosphate isomerase-like protein (cupin superfamily)
MRAGTCFYQPPSIRHRELAHSKDLQMIEVVAPAKFETRDAKPPARTKSRRRR